MPTPREMYEEAQRRKEAQQRAKRTGGTIHTGLSTHRDTDLPAQNSIDENIQLIESTQIENEQHEEKAIHRQEPPQDHNAQPAELLPYHQYARNTIMKWRMRAVRAFGIIMALGCIIGLLFFLRPTTSALEMRNLTQFPAFTIQSFLEGSYFTKVSLWYADTYPLRELMVAADRRIDMLFGITRDTAMVGGNVKADEIPEDVSATETVPVDVQPPAEAPDEKVVAADIQENIMSGVYIKNGIGYSIYYFSKNAADTYIAAMNKAAERLDGKAKIYSIMAPANCITLPDDDAALVGGSDQQQALDYLSTRYDSRIVPVDLIDIIKKHRNEYLFFKTDHHWTQLGGYYAYVAFCEKKGVTPIELSSMEKVSLGEFIGTYYGTIESKGYKTKDTIDAYIPSSTNEMNYVSLYGEETKGNIINLQAREWDPSYKYSAFIAGDQPLEVIHNPKINDGSSCLVVKDSYGCAFVPNLVDQYETVHVIDFRSTDKNICDYVLENEIQEVIFMTGMKIGLTDTVAQTLLSEVQ